MRPEEMEALIAQGLDALKAATGLSAHEQQIVNAAIAGLEAGDGRCGLCSHASHEGPCPYRTADEYCDCGLPADAPIPEVIEKKTKK